MHFTDWYKKDVVLKWQGGSWPFAVAQELFSSHEVDSGSVLLLRSLDVERLPEHGRCLDYGCGYGVLGLAIGAVRPGWEIVLIDRDALAVAFSAHNAEALGITAQAITALDPLDVSEARAGYDLLLWNVPGKAGPDVLTHLTDECLDVLAPGGVLALVVVHPLAETIRAAITAREDMAIVHESAGREHTVIHAQRISGQPSGLRDGFAAGIFDREPIAVDYGDYLYPMVPVVGLPQYDGPNQTTLMVMDVLSTLPTESDGIGQAVVYRPGVGHVAKALRVLEPKIALTVLDRDMLAVQASGRALGTAAPLELIAAPDFDGVEFGYGARLAVAMIPDQMRPPVMARLLDALAVRVHPGGQLVVGGDSTEVSRFVALAKKRPELRLRDQRKRRGVSVALIERRGA